MKRFITFVYAILAGAFIAFGGTVYLSVENKVMGSLLFSVGLFVVCTFGFNLFTGKVCYIFEKDRDYRINIPMIWLGNLAGAVIVAWLESLTRIGPALAECAVGICATKLGDSLLSIFILAIFCNIMIYLGVDSYNRNNHQVGKYLAMILGIMVFILCGFEHCVANMYYFTIGRAWSLKAVVYLLVMTAGNTVGGVIFPLLRQWKEKETRTPAAEVKVQEQKIPALSLYLREKTPS